MSTVDKLGESLKEEYEFKTRLVLPARTHTIIRLDGNAFHTYTRGLPKPFDETLHDDLVSASAFLCAKISGAQLAYVQSDEVSILVTDFANVGTQAWFGGVVQKIASVSASILTAKFNELRNVGLGDLGERLAFFDARAFAIGDPEDVVQYFSWRHMDAMRNAIYSAARTLYSHKELQGVGGVDQLDMLRRAGVMWPDAYPEAFRYGTVIHRDERVEDVEFTHQRTGERHVARDVKRHIWTAVPATHDAFPAHLNSCLLG